MKLQEIKKQLEAQAPIIYAENWDNVGLLVGRAEQEVNRVMIALDATDSVIAQCIENKIDLLITHHPMIFSSMKRVTDMDFIGRRILQLVEHHIAYYAMHTNYDVCVMNDVAADYLQLQAEDVLEPVMEENMGIGKVGTLPKEISVEELAQKVKNKFAASNVLVTGNPQNRVKRVAVSTGAGKSMVDLAIQKKAQVLITGDIDHHSAIDALAQGLQIIDAGHFGTEHFMVEETYRYLKEKNGENLAVFQAKEKDPFTYIE